MASVFNEDIEGYKSLIALQDTFKKGLKENITLMQKASKSLKFDNLKDIEKVDDEIKKITAAEKELINIQKEEARLQKQLKDLTDEEVKAKIRFQKANKAQKDELKDLLILQNKEAGTLEKLGASSRKLRREREKLNLETTKGKKRLQEINKQLDKNNAKIKKNSDALKKQKLNVGAYSSSIKEAAQSSGLFGGVLGKLNAIQGTLQALRKKSIITEKISINNTYKQIAASKALTNSKKSQLIAQKALNTAVKASLVGIALIAAGGLVATFTRTQKRVDQLSDAMASMGAIVDIVIDRFSQVGEGLIKVFNKSLQVFTKFRLNYVIGAKKLKKELQEALSFEIAGKQFGFAQEQISKTTKEIELLTKELNDLPNVEGGLNLITTAFDNLGEEIKVEIALASKFNSLRRELNREQKIFSIHLNDEIAANKELQLIIRNKIIDDKIRLAAIEKITESETKLANEKIRFAKEELRLSLDSEKSFKNLSAERKEFIQQLRDGSITADEAIAKAEQFTLSSSAGEEALFNIIEKINNLKKEEIEFDQKLIKLTKQRSGLLKEIGAKVSKGIIVVAQNELKLAKDLTRTQEERHKNLITFQDESIRGYKVQLDANIITLEEFNARRLQAELIYQQELKKMQISKDSAAFQLEEFRREQGIKTEKDLETRIQKELSLVNFRTEKLLENETLLEDEITLIKEKAEAERMAIVKKGDEDRKKLSLKEIEDRKKLAEKSNEIVGEIADFQREKFDERQKRIDDEINASEKQQERLLALADKGSEDAQKNLASSQKREAELRLQKQQEQKKQEQTELLFKGLDTYSARLAQGQSSGEALAGTVTDIAALGQALRTVAFFKDGTEDTGTVAKPLDTDGGRFAVLHDNERVVDKMNNFKMSGITNSELGNLAQSYKMGELVQAEQNKINVISGSYLSNEKVLAQLSGIETALKSLPNDMPKSSLNVDLIKQVMTLSESRGGQTVHNHIKINNRKSWS